MTKQAPMENAPESKTHSYHICSTVESTLFDMKIYVNIKVCQ